jgi:hypothetical protein
LDHSLAPSLVNPAKTVEALQYEQLRLGGAMQKPQGNTTRQT